MSYYHDARAHARKLKHLEEDSKRRAERKAEIADTQVEHPLNYLFVEGRSCKIHRNTEQHQNLENGTGLIPWNSSQIDRFDGRALLDFYKEPDSSAWSRPKASQEEKLEQSLRFESFRDVVRLMAKGLSEPEGLAFARQENIEIRAAMRAAATAAAAAAAGQRNPQPLAMATPAGMGSFAAVGFNYGGGGGGAPSSGAGAGNNDNSSSSSSDSDSDDESGGEGADGDDVDAKQEAEDDRIDDIAEQYHISDFSYRLHRALQQEGEEEARLRKPPRRRVSRKGARERARRMAGMGLDPTGAPMGHARDWTQPPPRSAAQDIRILPPRPARDAQDDASQRPRGSRSRSRSSSRSRSRSPRSRHNHNRRQDPHASSSRPQFITEFSSLAPSATLRPGNRGGVAGGPSGVAALEQQQRMAAANRPTIDRSMFERDESILDALPDMPDPAALGPQPIPLPPTSVQAIRAAADSRRDRSGATHGGGGGSGGGGGGAGSSRRERERDDRERERERTRDYHGYSYRRRYERRSSRSRSRSRSRDRERERERDRDRDRDRDHERQGGGGGGSDAERFRDRQRSGLGANASSGLAAGKAAAAGAITSGATTASAQSGGGGTSAGPATGAAAAAAAKETPQERLKRIMAAQLNKQAQKDHLLTAQRKLQVEKEKEARQALERVVMKRSPSPPSRDRGDQDSYHRGRSRSRSRSPRGGTYRRRSRSR